MNVLLITTEQHHRALGNRAPIVRTRALDRVAADGLVFDRAYCVNPTCSPSWATILTGWYPAWHGCWTNGVKLPEDVPTISGLLSQLGYATSLIGRANFAPPTPLDLDFWRRWTGPYYGFDHVELAGEGNVGQHYALWLEERGAGAEELPAELHHSAWTAERTIAAIEAAVLAGQPFFCWAGFGGHHGMITLLDRQIGRILARLETLGVAGDTLVVFTSDHGWHTGRQGLTEEMLRVPLVVRWPGRVPAGTRTNAPHAHVDLAPTLLDALEVAVPGQMQGESQLPVWRGEQDRVRDHVIVEHRDQLAAVHLRCYLEDRYKITIYRGRDHGDLFDLAEDPQERHNRFHDPDYATVKTALMHRFLDAELRREPTRTPLVVRAGVNSDSE
jgi:arylsulfatase A-like enzyme